MKQIIKKILSGIGTVFAVTFSIVLLLCLSPIILGVILFFGSIALYARLWEGIRHDPKRNLDIEGLASDDWPSAETGEEFTREFKKLSDKIAEMSKAVAGRVKREGFSSLDEPSPKIKWTKLNLSQTLYTEHAEVTLSFDFGAYYSEHREGIVVSTEDGDDQCEAGFPAVAVSIAKPKFHIERSFTVRTFADAWMVIGILRGNEKFTQNEGQLWSYMPEYNVWIVQYKIDKSDYGLRNAFTGRVAHKYSRDH